MWIKKKSRRWCTRMMIFRVLIGTWLIFLMSCNSLQELQKANLKRQQDAHARMKDQYVTLEKPSDTNVNVSGDGLKIDSTHYSLSFSEDLQQYIKFLVLSQNTKFMLFSMKSIGELS